MPENRKGVPSFPDVDAAIAALSDKDNFRPSDLYPRDGTVALSQLESRVAELVGVSDENVVLYNTGMTAVTEAIEVEHPKDGMVLLHGQQLYSQTARYIDEHLRPRGVKVVGVDSGSALAVRNAIERHQPDIVLFETVANGPDMPVLDLPQLLSNYTLRRKGSLVILDNTLPTPVNYSLSLLIADDDLRILGVESGTKFYGLNTEMLGLIYTHHAQLLDLLRRRRRTVGGLPSLSAVEYLREVFPDIHEFAVRSERTARNTFNLAKAFNFAAEQSGAFTVAYPNLDNHPNSKIACRDFPKGASPVLFLNPTEVDQFELTRMLWANEVIRGKCELGQSFGFDRTRIWPDANYPTVRVAGGTEDRVELEQICEAITIVFQ